MPETSPANRARAALRYLLDAWALTDVEDGSKILNRRDALDLISLVVTQNGHGPDAKFGDREGVKWFVESISEHLDSDDLRELGITSEPSFDVVFSAHIRELHAQPNVRWCTERLCQWEDVVR